MILQLWKRDAALRTVALCPSPTVAWGDTLLSLPRRWLSTQVYGADDEDFQNVQLPKLPVPELESTMETYLEFAAVVVSQQALEHSRGLVRGFLEELGPRLQEMLLDRQKEMDNWSKDDEETFLSHSNCGKEERNNTHSVPVVSDKPEPIEGNAFRSKLQRILYKALIQTKDLHKYTLKRENTTEELSDSIDLSLSPLYQSTTKAFDVNNTANTISLQSFTAVETAETTTTASSEIIIENVDVHLPSSLNQKIDVLDITTKIPINDAEANNRNEYMSMENILEKSKHSQKKASAPDFEDLTTIRKQENNDDSLKYTTNKINTYIDGETDGINDYDTTKVLNYVEDLSHELLEHDNIDDHSESNNIVTEKDQPETGVIINSASFLPNATNDMFVMQTTKTPEDNENNMEGIIPTLPVDTTTTMPIKLKPVDITMLGSKIYLLDPFTMQNILNRGTDQNKEQMKYPTDKTFVANGTLNSDTNSKNSAENPASVETVTSPNQDILTKSSWMPIEMQVNSFTYSIELGNAKNDLYMVNSQPNFIESTTPMIHMNSNPTKSNRPTWRSTEKTTIFKDRIDSIRNYLYKADNVKATSKSVLLEQAPAHEDSPRAPPRPAPARALRRDHGDVTDWWLDDMYLKVRLPLPINSNPGMVFPRRHFAKMEEVADLGALFIDDLLDYKEMLDRGELPLERATSREKGQPLCMEQFYRLLGVCRIPEVGRDRLEFPRPPPSASSAEDCEELVVVACRNYFYPIPVKAADRGRLTPGEMQAQLLHAMVDAAGAPPAPRVGLLTSMNRDHWARAREILIKDEMNRMNMELISRALCILCLDEAGGDRADTDADTNAMLRAMHGAGTRYHSANRWFDKTVQLIISSDGTIGMCYEHSAAEGVAVVRLAERALARAEVAARPAPPPALLPAPQAMKWNVTSDVQRTIEQAARDLDRAISDLDHKVYTYRNYGREFMKSCRTSPDVYIQLALQYAYYKMYGYLVTTYESASLRRFRNGRVDNIRSAHGAALAWAAAMCTAETPPLADADDGHKKVSFNLYGEQKKLELFEEAARKQTSIMEANILGKGLDNHLLGLREAARETLGELPPVFSDNTYKQMIEFKLSTSQVATTTDGTFMGYGAVCPDGYGCSYNPKKDSIIFCISSFTSSSVTNTEAFRQSLEEALDSMKLMFQARKVEN
ncbi:unnamed protein product [Chrysodeixis includens]|uniref:Choline O-acetyltransferase n=1 Tax=Chrysodeixis includens TaxID=689277 RepID=A0A9N8Q0E1_CHRIL|nr:unnamed protein product [Chrysodeixis includens]